MNKQETKIFVVDDDMFQTEMVKQVLHSQDFLDVHTFDSGEACLEEIHQNPDIVFLDHQMGEYTGDETLQKIKRFNPNIFVVMVTGQEDISTAVGTLKHGAFDYIQKNEDLEKNIIKVLDKIEIVTEMLRENKTSLLKKILKYI